MINPFNVIDARAGELPVPVFDIIRESGVELTFEFMDDNVSGWIQKLDNGKYRVAVNNGHALVRQRFTAAHELGHYIYHRSLFGNGVGDTRAYRSLGTPYANSSILPVHERQANSFAANLLMPQKSIDFLRSLGITDTREMASRFLVSEAALRIRLGLPEAA